MIVWFNGVQMAVTTEADVRLCVGLCRELDAVVREKQQQATAMQNMLAVLMASAQTPGGPQ